MHFDIIGCIFTVLLVLFLESKWIEIDKPPDEFDS